MQPKSILFALPAILAALSVGCGVETETLEAWKEAVHSSSIPSPASLAGSGASEPVDQHFEPPHPDRVDPFSFPTNVGPSDPAGPATVTVAQVHVLGFADVDQPRVFLRSGDRTGSLKVGEVANGVEVVAINPPAVELRMGSLVWTATMFDHMTSSRD